MAKTYAQLNAEIEVLKAKADAARKKEIAGVIARIKKAVAFYELTAADLGLGKDGKSRPATEQSTATSGKQNKPQVKTKVAVKYRDQSGNSWTGRGSRPRWLVAALASGRALDSFAVNGSGEKAIKQKTRLKAGPPSKATKGTTAGKYSDGNHHWSGRGPKPGWLKQALAAGKTLDELRG